MSSRSFEAVLTPERTVRILILIVFLLLLGHLAALYTKHIASEQYGMLWVFHFDSEANIPALYSFVIIMACGALLWATASLHEVRIKQQTRFWKTLSCLCIIAALDEFTGFHQVLTTDSLKLLGDFTADGYLYFKWIIPYCLFFALMTAFLLNQFIRLPIHTKLTFLLGGTIFFVGAILFEMLGGHYLVTHPGESKYTSLNYALLATVEELLEMIGIIIFLYGIMKFYIKHAEQEKLEFKIRLAEKNTIDF